MDVDRSPGNYLTTKQICSNSIPFRPTGFVLVSDGRTEDGRRGRRDGRRDGRTDRGRRRQTTGHDGMDGHRTDDDDGTDDGTDGRTEEDDDGDDGTDTTGRIDGRCPGKFIYIHIRILTYPLPGRIHYFSCLRHTFVAWPYAAEGPAHMHKIGHHMANTPFGTRFIVHATVGKDVQNILQWS